MNEISLDAPFTSGFNGEKSVGDVLIVPTALYPSIVGQIKKKLAMSSDSILGMAHITGGGFTENIPRMLPEGLGVKIHLNSWKMHPVFPWLQEVCIYEQNLHFPTILSLQVLTCIFFMRVL